VVCVLYKGKETSRKVLVLLVAVRFCWWLMADGWCWFVLREKYCLLVVGG
jgi:hypothetical protein